MRLSHMKILLAAAQDNLENGGNKPAVNEKLQGAIKAAQELVKELEPTASDKKMATARRKQIQETKERLDKELGDLSDPAIGRDYDEDEF